MEAPPARSCAPTNSEGIARGAWDTPSPQSVPESRSLDPEASAKTAGRHGHAELDVIKPSSGPSRRRLLPPTDPSRPHLAMAPEMSGRGGAALLCLSALLAHGKCRGADSGVKMRRAPLEGAEGGPQKEGTPSPPLLDSSVGSHLALQLRLPRPLSPPAGAEAGAPRGDQAGPRHRVGGGGRLIFSGWKEGFKPLNVGACPPIVI